jgi:hypothetical protein
MQNLPPKRDYPADDYYKRPYPSNPPRRIEEPHIERGERYMHSRAGNRELEIILRTPSPPPIEEYTPPYVRPKAQNVDIQVRLDQELVVE